MSAPNFSKLKGAGKPERFTFSTEERKSFREVMGKAIRESKENSQKAMISASKIFLNQ